MDRLGKRVLLIIYAAIIIIPMLTVFFSTFKTTSQMYENPIGLPESFNFSNYVQIFNETAMATYFKNSVIVTLVSVTFTLFFASLIAYAITRMNKWMGGLLFGLFTLGMMVPAQVNMIPLYSLIYRLDLTNTLSGLMIVNISVTLPVAVFILTGFMKTIPKELFEACTIDGANNWQVYRRIALPLSLPSLSATAIFLFVMHWNDLLYPLLFITKDEYKTLPLALLEFQGQYMTNFPMLFTGVMIASAPMIIAYVFLQRYFIAGMTAGSVKG
ncbi:carbohydrate ABC transporter permease [Halobacillus aidingensis]|uniref:Raffinose/stachyose/melibiose transport system permease protein n=1 Tax=Halobacillus aidingensis TaxID=240303 RepID=A0A1H0H9H6_HALAD|nr:carbohydrate ABC transporter permease [Halobacillus aidingensis]SDO15571.1 raffinose/stachyose/melibiose transport system permease protein [Halobacillus aidingensis]